MTKTESQIPVKDIAQYLVKTNHELRTINSKNATTPKLLEDLAAKVWKCHVAADMRIKQLETEKAHIQSSLKRMWDLFSETISPAMKIHDDLVVVYTELTSILHALETLKSSHVSQETLTTELAVLQDRLHKVEAKKDSSLNQFCVKKDQAVPEIPFGQAVCSSLLDRCYKLAHRLACSSELGSKEPCSELQETIYILGTILETLKNGVDVDPILLKMIADDLIEMENAKVGNVFYEKDGSVATNQKQVKKEMQTAHDLLNECVAYLLKRSKEDYPLTSDSVKALLKKVELARQNLELQVEEDYRNVDDFHALMVPVHEAIVHFKEEASSAIGSTKSLLASVVQSAFRLANEVFEKIDPVDPKLADIYEEIKDIIAQLQVIRNSWNWERLQQRQLNQPIFDKYGEELQKIDFQLQALSKKLVNGEWQVFNDDGTVVDAGQGIVSNAYNHAVVLFNDLLFQKISHK